MRKKTLLLYGTIPNTERKGWRDREGFKRLSMVSATDHLISWKNVKEPCKSRLCQNDAFHRIGTVSNSSSICGEQEEIMTL